jgi:hypothetical protein
MPDRVKEASFTWNWATNSDSDRSPGLSSAEAACLRTHQARHPVYLLRAGTSRGVPRSAALRKASLYIKRHTRFNCCNSLFSKFVLTRAWN